MAITAKPSDYSFNSAVTHAPAHLYMLDEGSGTTLTDIGATGGYDLTITGADWATDGTHGPILSFVQANTDYARNTSISGLSGTITAVGVVLGQAGTGSRVILSFGDNSQLDRYTTLIYQGDEDLEEYSDKNGLFCISEPHKLAQPGSGKNKPGWQPRRLLRMPYEACGFSSK